MKKTKNKKKTTSYLSRLNISLTSNWYSFYG